ncbi:MAG: acyl carrier protein [Planctomycetes bacterium]|nr:acyl carrier protein [Planctomycetota bacterium]
MSDAAAVDRAPLRAHFLAKIGGDPALLPADSQSLAEEGILDSFGLAELLLLIERAYGVRVPDGDASVERFESIDKIVRYIAARR